MTTRNLNQDGIASLRAAITRTADDVRNRADAVSAQAAEVERQRRTDARNALIAARALDRQHADKLDVLDEEANQLAWILVGDPQPEPTPEPAPVAVVQQTPDLPPPPPAPQPTQAQPVVEAAPRRSTVPGLPKLGWIEVVFAVIAALIAFAVAWATWDWFVSLLTDGIARNEDGSFALTRWEKFWRALWYIAVIGTGAYIGAVIGYWMARPFIKSLIKGYREGRDRRNQQRGEETAG